MAVAGDSPDEQDEALNRGSRNRPGKSTGQTTRPAPAVVRRGTDKAEKKATLSRALSKLGYCSRTQAEVLIAAGRVSARGVIVTDPETWVELSDGVISVDGVPVIARKTEWLMLNKPRGMVTTRSDPEGRATVFDCLDRADAAHISPVGRLDKASEGLLLFTNDTVMADRLLDPATHLPKIYHVQIKGEISAQQCDRMLEGIIEGGETLAVSAVRPLRGGETNCWLEITLQEGKNRQIRRILEALGIECLRLVRISIGSLQLGDLPKGSARALTADEVALLHRETGAKA